MKNKMSSLQELCLQNIYESIQKAPPVIQDMIIGETKERIKEKIITDVKSEYDILPALIPEIIEDIIYTMTRNNRLRKNFHELYPNVNKDVMNCAISSAEECVRRLDQKYIHNAFYMYQIYNYEDSDTEEDDDYNDY